MRVFVIVNAAGGTVRAGGVEADGLAAMLAAAGLDAEVVFAAGTEIQSHAERALAAAIAGRIDAVVVGGGDGTVGAVAGVLAGSDVPLGVLPLGTLNHFAKDLGLPQNLAGAVQVIAAGRARAVDVAEVNGRVFINNSSVGIYPYMVADRDRRQSTHGRGKWPAMAAAFARMLWRFPRRRLSLRTEGRTEPYRTPCLFVGNNEYGMELARLGQRERLDGGQLWLFVAKQRSAAGLLWFALRTVFGRVDHTRDFEALQADAVELRMRASRVPVALDGEVATMRPPLRYRMRAGALRVLAPLADPS